MGKAVKVGAPMGAAECLGRLVEALGMTTQAVRESEHLGMQVAECVMADLSDMKTRAAAMAAQVSRIEALSHEVRHG